MTKMSKVIAALGVVAGLGVAALPLSSYAALPTDGYTTSTTAKVEATVEGAISIASQINGSAADTVNLGEVMPGSITKETDPLDIIVTSNTAGAKFDLYVRSMNDGNMVGKTTGDKIAAGTPKGGESKWGFKYTTDGTAWTNLDTTPADKYGAIPTTDTKLNSSNLVTVAASSKAEQKSSFKFQASTAPTLTADTYTGSVVFTAVVE